MGLIILLASLGSHKLIAYLTKNKKANAVFWMSCEQNSNNTRKCKKKNTEIEEINVYDTYLCGNVISLTCGQLVACATIASLLV